MRQQYHGITTPVKQAASSTAKRISSGARARPITHTSPARASAKSAAYSQWRGVKANRPATNWALKAITAMVEGGIQGETSR